MEIQFIRRVNASRNYREHSRQSFVFVVVRVFQLSSGLVTWYCVHSWYVFIVAGDIVRTALECPFLSQGVIKTKTGEEKEEV